MDIVSLVVYLVVVGLIFWLIWWFIGFVGLPEPFNKIAQVLVGLVAFLLVLGLLLNLLGASPVAFPAIKLR